MDNKELREKTTLAIKLLNSIYEEFTNDITSKYRCSLIQTLGFLQEIREDLGEGES